MHGMRLGCGDSCRRVPLDGLATVAAARASRGAADMLLHEPLQLRLARQHHVKLGPAGGGRKRQAGHRICCRTTIRGTQKTAGHTKWALQRSRT